MNETILIILIACGIGNHIEKQKPKEMLYEKGNGLTINTIVDKNNYYCPQYCSTVHKHSSHLKNKQCDMKNACYHFVHNNDYNIAELLEDDKKEIAANNNKRTQIISSNLKTNKD